MYAKPTVRLMLTLTVALAAAACGPKLPAGVDEERLSEAVSDAIGDPNTCVLVGRPGDGAIVWRYNTHTTCARALPACEPAGATQTVADLLKAVARDGQPRHLSCNSIADASRGVGWAAGRTPKKGLLYAAAMEGPRALPGRIMSDKLETAWSDAGL